MARQVLETVYLMMNERLGDPSATCRPAADRLERLSDSLKWFNKEAKRTHKRPDILKTKSSVVVDDARELGQRLTSYIDKGCCQLELFTLESEVKALPWPAHFNIRSEATVRKTGPIMTIKLPPKDIMRAHTDIVQARKNLMRAINQALITAASRSTCPP